MSEEQSKTWFDGTPRDPEMAQLEEIRAIIASLPQDEQRVVGMYAAAIRHLVGGGAAAGLALALVGAEAAVAEATAASPEPQP